MSKSPGFLPLYQQVYELLVGRIVDGTWGPGEALPNEHALAAELGVSQGTVRKALNVMESEQLLERRQGKGTYVMAHTQESSLFKFFRFSTPDGERVTPQSVLASVRRRKARKEERAKLGLATGETVIELKRARDVRGAPVLWERVVLSAKLFSGFEKRESLPNALYALYQSEYGVSIASVRENISASLVDREDARHLDLPLGSPLLHIDRESLAIDGRCVELRTSRCDTRQLVYAITLN